MGISSSAANGCPRDPETMKERTQCYKRLHYVILRYLRPRTSGLTDRLKLGLTHKSSYYIRQRYGLYKYPVQVRLHPKSLSAS